MKKSLLAAAVLGAFAGSAMAANVALYGVVDTGLQYTHSKVVWDGETIEKNNSFEMKSGNQLGSRWGLKGVEDLGNGYKVGFILESGFDSDTGKGKDQFFNRESSLFVEGSFGRLLFGRMGSVNQGVSSTGRIDMISAFGTSYGDYSSNALGVFAGGKVLPNMITYQSPTFSGLQIHAQYAMSNDDGDGADENKARKTDRYFALAATYSNGPLSLYGAVDATDYAHDKGEKHHTASTYTLGGNYDFGVVKLFGALQYFNEYEISEFQGAFEDVFYGARVKGWGAQLSASVPLAGGTMLAGVGYMDGKMAKSEEWWFSKNDVTRIRATVGYAYPLSKRTQVYAAASYGKEDCEWGFTDEPDNYKDKANYATAFIGLRHTF